MSRLDFVDLLFMSPHHDFAPKGIYLPTTPENAIYDPYKNKFQSSENSHEDHAHHTELDMVITDDLES